MKRFSVAADEPILERVVEQALVRAAKKRGGMAFKLVIFRQAGWPDRTVIMPGGRIGFVECKRPGQRPTNLQWHWIKKLRAWGFDARVIDHPDQVDPYFAELFGE